MSDTAQRIYLSPPDMAGREREYVAQAFADNWIAPVGPHLASFEQKMAAVTGCGHAVALSSGTAGLHLALRLCGVRPGDCVICSTLTFVASVNPVVELGAEPVLVDSERQSWNMDPALLAAALADAQRRGKRPAAVLVVHLYGQCADMEPILSVCASFGVPLIEDAAEALGASHGERHAGTMGRFGIFSFNGNKIITTSGGGMLVSQDAEAINQARFLATQAREPVAHYEHRERGYNYRMSNVLAGIGLGQLEMLEQKVARRRQIFAQYCESLGDLEGVRFMPEAPWGRATRWLTCLELGATAPCTPKTVFAAMEQANIECRPVWKPMHLQPLYASAKAFLSGVSEDLFHRGLCLPSGSGMTDAEQERVVQVFRRAFGVR